MKSCVQRSRFTRLFLSLSLAACLVLSATGQGRAVQVEGNVDSDGTEGVKPLETPPDMTNAAGDATYMLPLTAPPGIHGMAPHLSLTYSSSQGNGRFGVGWDFSVGYPLTIERSTRKGVPTYRTEEDEFTLGGKPLVRDGDVFHTRIENFCKIEIMTEGCYFCGPDDHPQPTQWRVILKDGTQLVYTIQPWSRGIPNRVFRWHLTSVTDVYGNRMSFHYEAQTDDRYGIRHPYLTRITYGYPQPDGGGTPLNDIQFWVSDDDRTCWSEDATREDTMVSHRHGVPDVIANRYERVVVKHDDQVVRTYDLDYDYSPITGRSLLVAVHEIGHDGKTLPPYEFTYENGTISWTDRSDDYSGTEGFPPVFNMSWFDQKGAGIRTMDTGVRLGDLNGDGLVDVLISNNRDPGRQKTVMINNGDGTFDRFEDGDAQWQIPFYFNQMLDANLMDRGVRVVDINGDGLADIIQSVHWMGSLIQHVCINNGSGWDCEDRDDLLPSAPFVIVMRSPGFSAHSYDMGIRLADLNGDGLVDMIRSIGSDEGNPQTSVWLNGGDNSWRPVTDGRWAPPRPFASAAVTNWASRHGPALMLYLDAGARMVDVNGDGLDDLVVSMNDTTGCGSTLRETWLNTGETFEGPYDHELPFFVYRYPFAEFREDYDGRYLVQIELSEDYGVTFTDINGDGSADCVWAYTDHSDFHSGAFLGLDDGQWERCDIPLPVAFTVAFTNTYNKRRDQLDNGVRWGDVNSDGLADLIQGRFWFDDTRRAVYHRNGAKPDLLVQNILPTGGRTEFVYEPAPWTAPDEGPYADQPDEAGLVSPPFIKWVVASVKRTDPLTGYVIDRRYCYDGPVYDHEEREFRGFKYVKTYLVRGGGGEGPFTERWYGQTDALQGLLLSERSGEGDFVTEVTHTYQPVESPPGVFFQKLIESTTRITCENGRQEKFYNKKYIRYDDYGNLKDWIDWGDTSRSDDDIRHHTEYVTHTDADSYIVDRVGLTKISAVTGRVLALTRHTYSDDLRFKTEDKEAEQYPISTSKSVLLTTRYTHHDWGDVHTATDPRGMVTEYVYHGTGGSDNGKFFPSKTIRASGTDQEQVKQTSYDLRYGTLSWKIEPTGERTEYTYDGLGRVKTVSKPQLSAPPIEHHQYTSVGKDLGPGRPNVNDVVMLPDGYRGELTQSFIDGFGNVVQTRRDNQGMGHYSGLVVRNNCGEKARIYLPFESRQTGFVGESALPSGLSAVERAYKAGKIDVVRHPETPEGSAVTQYWYGAGYVIAFDPEGILTATFHDVHGDTIRTIEDYHEANITTTLKRDPLGRLISVTDARRQATTYGYDPRGNLLGKSCPEWSLTARNCGAYPAIPYQVRYTYDDSNHLVLESWGTRLRIKHRYDILGREVAVGVSDDGNVPDCSDGSRELRRRFFYDRDDSGSTRPFGWGKLLVAKSFDESGREVSRIDYFYNAQGLVERIAVNNRGAFAEMHFVYDNTGRLVSLTDAQGRVIRYNRDHLGRLNRLDNIPAVSVNGTGVVEDVDYDEKGRVRRIAYGNGTATTYDYDDRNFLRTLDHGLDSQGNPIYGANLTYDLVGNVRTITQGSTSATFSYDPLHRLQDVSDSGFYGRDFHYEYDGVGNLLRKVELEDIAFTVRSDSNLIDHMDLIGQHGTRRYVPRYDDRGNMIDDGGLSPWRHTYGFNNRIRQSAKTTRTSNTEKVTFTYDAFDRKIHRSWHKGRDREVSKPSKTASPRVAAVDGRETLAVTSAAEGGSSTGGPEPDRWYFYDTADRPIYEKDSHGSKLNIYALGRRVARVTSDGTVTYFHHDHLGSTVAATNSDQKIPATDTPPETPSDPETLWISGPSVLPVWEPGSYQAATFHAEGGHPPYDWTLRGILPSSLDFSDGRLSGTAGMEDVGVIQIEITVSDMVANTATRGYELKVLGPLRLVTKGLEPVHCRCDDDCYEYYEDDIKVQGGRPPYTWTLDGELPFELEYEPEGDSLWIWGDVECSLADDAYVLSVTVRDRQTPPATASRTYTLSVEN